jgi:uncharacterized membrane protein
VFTYIVAFLIGMIAGLRSMTAPAAVAWAAGLGWLHLENTDLASFGSIFSRSIFTLLAILELIADKLPKTPSRKSWLGFTGRILTSALCGVMIGAAGNALIGGILAAELGALLGTLGGYEFRTRLVRATGGKDLPIALLEDAIAIGGAFVILSR